MSETNNATANLNPNTSAASSADARYTVEYILSQIVALQNQTAYLQETIAKLAEMDDGTSGDPGSPGNLLGQAKANALGGIVTARETTTQQLLRLYEKMYDDLIHGVNSSAGEVDKWNAISKLADVALHDDDFASERSEMIDAIRQILRESK